MKPEDEVTIDPIVRIETLDDFFLSDFGWYWLTEDELPDIKVDILFIDPFTKNRFHIPNLVAKLYLAKSVWDSGAPMLQNLPLEGQVSAEVVDGIATFSGIKYCGKTDCSSLQAHLIISIVSEGKESECLPKGVVKALISNPIWITDTPIRSTSVKKQILADLIVNDAEGKEGQESGFFPSPTSATRVRSSSRKKSMDPKGGSKVGPMLNKPLQPSELSPYLKSGKAPESTRKIFSQTFLKK